MGSCGTFGTFAPFNTVQGHLNTIIASAQDWGQSAEQIFQDTGTFMDEIDVLENDESLYQFSFSTDLSGMVSTYNPPAAVEEPNFPADDPAGPRSVSFTPEVEAPLAITKPSFTEVAPSLDFGGQPGAAPEVGIGDPPAIVDEELADFVVPSDPIKPSLSTVSISPIVPIADVDTDYFIPEVLTGSPSSTISYTEPGSYSSTQLTLIGTELDRVLGGDFAIPSWIWNQIRERAAVKVNREQLALERSAARAHSARGWEMPGGAELSQIEVAQQTGAEQRNVLAFENASQEAVQKREDFWSAIERGISTQQLLQQDWSQAADRALQFATVSQQASVSAFNAVVNRFNALVGAAAQRAAKARLELDEALAFLESQRLELQAAQARGELNEQLIRIYVAEWEGVRTAAQAYESRVNAVNAKLENQRLKLEHHKLKLESKDIELRAWVAEWDGWSKKMNGEAIKLEPYKVEAGVFGELMRGYQTEATVQKTQKDTELGIGDLGLRAEVARAQHDLGKFEADWRGLGTRLESAARQFQSRISLFGEKVRGEDTRSQVSVRAADINQKETRIQQDAHVARLQLISERVLRLTQIEAGLMQALGNFYSSLTSAAYAAANVNASMSGGISESISCNETHAN